MGNVVQLHLVRTSDAPRPTSSGAGRQLARRLVAGAMRNSLAVFRHVAFLALLWLRPALRLALGILAGTSLFSLIFIALCVSGLHHKSLILGGLAGVSFGASALMWSYDVLLLRLSPRPIVLM